MTSVMRLALAFLVACAVAALGVLLFGEFHSGDLAWYGVLLVAMFAGSLVDRERFYGPSEPRS